MKCQNCGEKNANVSYTKIINGDRMELHLCSECASKMNIGININLDFDNMFSNIFDDFAHVDSMFIPEMIGFNSFGTDSILKRRFLPESIFSTDLSDVSTKDELDDVLNSIQKKYNKPKKQEKNKEKSEIEQLKDKLQEYIKNEEYEKAAVIRDKIKELEKKGGM